MLPSPAADDNWVKMFLRPANSLHVSTFPYVALSFRLMLASIMFCSSVMTLPELCFIFRSFFFFFTFEPNLRGGGGGVTARNVLYSSSQEKWLSQLTNSEVHFADCRIYWLPFTYPTLVSVPSLVSHHTGSWQHTGTCHCHALSVVHLSPWCCRSLSHLNESKDIVWQYTTTHKINYHFYSAVFQQQRTLSFTRFVQHEKCTH